jgi:integrase
MTSLRQHAEEYLTARRALGFKLRSEGYLLTSFVTFADQSGAELITTELVVAWTLRAVTTDLNNLAKRMRVVRFFARYLYAIDPRNEVPPDDLCPSRGHRPTPYIYSDAEVAALMNGAKGLDAPLLAITMEALIGLLATTGMRIGEAIVLNCGDVNWDESLLIVRNAKYGKSREVLLHPSTVQALRHYVGERDQLVQVVDQSVFVSTRGTRINYSTVRQTFSLLRRRTFVGEAPRRARIHDLRHTFAVNTLLSWYRDGGEIATRTPLLSTYLGHANPASTYWYLSAVPELLSLAAQRQEQAFTLTLEGRP